MKIARPLIAVASLALVAGAVLGFHGHSGEQATVTLAGAEVPTSAEPTTATTVASETTTTEAPSETAAAPTTSTPGARAVPMPTTTLPASTVPTAPALPVANRAAVPNAAVEVETTTTTTRPAPALGESCDNPDERVPFGQPRADRSPYLVCSVTADPAFPGGLRWWQASAGWVSNDLAPIWAGMPCPEKFNRALLPTMPVAGDGAYPLSCLDLVWR